MRVQGTVEVNRPLHEVFDYVSDVRNYPNWMAHVLEVATDTPGPPQQSDRFVVAIKSVGRRFEIPYERIAFELRRRCTDQALGGPIPDHRWDSAFQEVRGVLKLLEPLQKRSAERQLSKDLQSLASTSSHAVASARASLRRSSK